MPLQSGSHFAIHTPLSLNSILGHLSFGLLLQSLKWSPASCFPSPINTTYCCQNYLPKIQISWCHCPHQTLKRFPDPTENSFFLTWKDLSPLSRSASSEISSRHASLPVAPATCELTEHLAVQQSTFFISLSLECIVLANTSIYPNLLHPSRLSTRATSDMILRMLRLAVYCFFSMYSLYFLILAFIMLVHT